jgi:hypothetical protein
MPGGSEDPDAAGAMLNDGQYVDLRPPSPGRPGAAPG